jgi:hypothetical protein
MFELDETQKNRLDEWVKEQYKKAVEIQKKEISNPNDTHKFCWDMGYPYEGFVGGGMTYCFTPTSIGIICVVKYSVTNEEIDLTDYEAF